MASPALFISMANKSSDQRIIEHFNKKIKNKPISPASLLLAAMVFWSEIQNKDRSE